MTAEPHRFIDGSGHERVGTQWGFNAFASEEGAVASGKELFRRKSTFYVWRYSDGTYDYTGVPNPGDLEHQGQWDDAILVQEVFL